MHQTKLRTSVTLISAGSHLVIMLCHHMVSKHTQTHTKQRMTWTAIPRALKALRLCHTTEGCHFVVTRWPSISHKLK